MIRVYPHGWWLAYASDDSCPDCSSPPVRALPASRHRLVDITDLKKGMAASDFPILQDASVQWDGQPVAVAIAETGLDIIGSSLIWKGVRRFPGFPDVRCFSQLQRLAKAVRGTVVFIARSVVG